MFVTFPPSSFETNLIFLQLQHLKYTFAFGENLKIQTPPPPPQKVHILNFGLFDFWLQGFFHVL